MNKPDDAEVFSRGKANGVEIKGVKVDVEAFGGGLYIFHRHHVHHVCELGTSRYVRIGVDGYAFLQSSQRGR